MSFKTSKNNFNNEPLTFFPIIEDYSSGYTFRLQYGFLKDLSPSNATVSKNHPTYPLVAQGLDNRNVFRWDAGTNSGQYLSVSSFLSGSTSATLYAVYTINANINYNIVQTKEIGDYWRFVNNDAGYFGTFRSVRFEAYPLNMPSSGSHLVSIHSSGTDYQVILDNVSKGVQSSTYTIGDYFRIGATNHNFQGDVAAILVYPYYIDPTDPEHTFNVAQFKTTYPSLPYTI